MKNRSLLALGGVAALAIAGCGSSSNDNASTTPSVSTPPPASAAGGSGGAGPASTVDIAETDYKLTPSDPKVKAGTVTFNVSNDGKVVHSLEVTGPGGEQRLTKELAPGQKGTLKAKLTKPGTYTMYCPVDGHKNMGMRGTVVVVGGGKGSSSSSGSGGGAASSGSGGSSGGSSSGGAY